MSQHQWLDWCQIEAVVSDNANIYGKPNFDEFKDHRHDQSIITNLVIKNNIKLFNPKSKSLNGSRDFNLAGCKINILQDSKLEIWQQAFPDCVISNQKTNLDTKPSNEEFTAVFANNCNQEDELPKILTTSYESLLPGGILFMGPFNGKKAKHGKLNASFNELIQWIFINQCFPPNLSIAPNQSPNAITLGNAHNPFIMTQGVDKNYVILRKPHMNLSLL